MLKFSNRPLLLSALGASLLLAGGLTGCAAQQKTGATATAKAPGHTVAGAVPAKMPACAMKIPGTTVAAIDIEGGVAIEFKNAGAVNELRKRVMGRVAYGKAHPKPTPIKMTRTLETTPEGVRILVRPADAANVDKVRAMVRKHLAGEHAETDAAKTTDTAKTVDDAPKTPAAPAPAK